jgi:hypothetical protein
MFQHYKKFKKALSEIDPKFSLDQFSQKLNLIFTEFQKNIGISEENLVRVENIVVLPISFDEKGELIQPTDVQKLPESITLERIWKKFGSFSGVTKIDGKDYYINTEEPAQHFVDSDGRLIIAPFFQNPDVLSTDSIEKKISSAEIFASYCKTKNQPELKTDEIVKRAELLESFFSKFITPDQPWFPKNKIDYRHMWNVLNAIEALEEYGFSPKQLKNIYAPTCQPRISGEGLFSFSIINGTGKNYPFSAVYDQGAIGFVNGAVFFKNVIFHEILHSFSGTHLDFYQSLKTILKKSDEVPMTILNGQGSFSVPEFHEDFGALDIVLIAMGKKLSGLNNGTRFESIQECYEPINFAELKKLMECKSRIPIGREQFLKLMSENSIESEFIQRLKDQILLIESPAIATRTVAEVFCNLLKFDDKSTEAIASYVENASRLVAIGSHYGARSVLNSLALPLITTTAKLTEGIFEKAGYTPPSERFDNLMRNFPGHQFLKRMGEFYKSQPEIIKNFINQAVFVSLLYTTCELFDRNEREEEYKKSKILSFGESVSLHFITSVASGALKILGSNLAKSIKSYLSSSRQPADLPTPTVDSENPANTVLSQHGRVSPDASPRSSEVSQARININASQSEVSSSLVFSS